MSRRPAGGRPVSWSGPTPVTTYPEGSGPPTPEQAPLSKAMVSPKKRKMATMATKDIIHQIIENPEVLEMMLGESAAVKCKMVLESLLNPQDIKYATQEAGQLRGDPGRAAVKRTVRPREGRLYRGDNQPCRAF